MPTQKKRIRKAVFPVAGLGTRFLPATKAMPKEMLTVVDRPVIQHVVDEARAAGIEHFIFVTGRNKGVIEDHFDSQFELERTLAERGKTDGARAAARELPERRPDQLHAPAGAARPRPRGVVRARDRRRRAVRGAAARRAALRAGHALPRPDDRGLRGARRQPHGRRARAGRPDASVRHRRRRGCRAPRSRASRSMVEKPKAGTAPSNLHISGRYILQPEIFEILEKGRSAAPAARSSSPTP